MRIWIDLSNAPHAQFFSSLIKDLRRSENEVLVTTRNFDHLTGILNNKGIEHEVVGEHGGSTLKGKLKSSSKRTTRLTDIISNFDPDLALSKHSVEASRVAFGLDIPSITVVDNENATAPNKLALPLTDKIIAPSSIPKQALTRQGANKESIITYNGFSEIAHVDKFTPDPEVLEKLSLNRNKPIIVIRTEPIMANYYDKDKQSIAYEIIPELNQRTESQIVLFPRTKKQKEKLSKYDVTIPENTIDSLSLLNYSDLMIGAGGTMNREAVAIGTPAISIYPQNLLSVTEHLIKENLLVHTKDPNSAIKEACNLLKNEKNFEEKIKQFINPLNMVIRTMEKFTGEKVIETSNLEPKEIKLSEKA